MTASYAISVRQARTLLTAFFRFRVTTDTLAVRLTVPTIRARRGLSPPSHQSTTIADWMALTRHAPYLAHIKKAVSLNWLTAFLLPAPLRIWNGTLAGYELAIICNVCCKKSATAMYLRQRHYIVGQNLSNHKTTSQLLVPYPFLILKVEDYYITTSLAFYLSRHGNIETGNFLKTRHFHFSRDTNTFQIIDECSDMR